MAGVMKFGDATFQNGIQCTVRRGIGWAGAAGEIKAIDAFDQDLGNIYVKYTQVMRFKDIPIAVLSCEHIGKTSLDKLLLIMWDCYNGFNRQEIVTIVWFTKE